jgi:hypothetical protein
MLHACIEAPLRRRKAGTCLSITFCLSSTSRVPFQMECEMLLSRSARTWSVSVRSVQHLLLSACALNLGAESCAVVGLRHCYIELECYRIFFSFYSSPACLERRNFARFPHITNRSRKKEKILCSVITAGPIFVLRELLQTFSPNNLTTTTCACYMSAALPGCSLGPPRPRWRPLPPRRPRRSANRRWPESLNLRRSGSTTSHSGNGTGYRSVS